MKKFFCEVIKIFFIFLIFISYVKSSRLSKRSVAIGDDNYKWSHGVIMYKINEKVFNSSRILSIFRAMRHWEASTCVKFVELDTKILHPDYIFFTKSEEKKCDSNVGQYYCAENPIRLADSCTHQDIIRQLGHIIGLYFEHQRPDRDEYVKVHDINIQSNHEFDFEKQDKKNVRTFSFPYDFNSIMQVGRRVGARSESEDTLTPVKKVNGKLPVIGDAKGASEIDIQVVNLLYNCPKCGRTIQETSGVIKSPVTPESLYSNQVIECEWRMLAPHGHRIKFAITSLDIYETADCATDYLEIADGYSDDKALRRKFCRTGNEASLHSTDNRMLVKYRKSGESTHKGFTAQYQQTCNHTIFVDGKTVHLESPNYPEPYGANQQCFWRLVAPENHQLAVKLDFVELENEEDNCSLKFDDGRTETSACALDKAAEYFSSDNYLNVTFIPRSIGRNGFSISVAVKILV